MMRVWNRCANLPDGYDSEEERMAVMSGAESQNGGMSLQGREDVAADALLMMAGLKHTRWEQNDYGEEAAYLASGMRKVRRRTDRWENGGTVVKKVKRDEGAEDGEDEGEPEEGYGEIERSSPAPVDDYEMEEERDEGNEMEEDD